MQMEVIRADPHETTMMVMMMVVVGIPLPGRVVEKETGHGLAAASSPPLPMKICG